MITCDTIRGKFVVAEQTLGIVLGFRNGRVKVKWFQMTALCPSVPGYYPWGALKVVSDDEYVYGN